MKIFSYLIIIFFAPALVLLNFQLLVFNRNFYKAEFSKLKVYEQFASKQEVDAQAQNLIQYLCCKQKLEGDFFTEREKSHLTDVKNLIRMASIQFFLLISLVLTCLILLIRDKKLKLLLFSLKWASLATIISILALWSTTFFDFQRTFISFHLIAFKNDFWLLPPEANLIKLFPKRFFADFANRIALQTIFVSVLVLILSYLAGRKIVAKSH